MAYTYGSSDLNEDYRFIDRVRFPNGESVSLEAVKALLQEECDANGIPVEIENATLKTGGLFNKQLEDILVVFNTEHRTDYLQFLIRITHQGRYAFMDVFKVGGSKNYANSNRAADSLTRSVFNSLSGHKQKLQEEENYYTILADCMHNIIS